MVSIGITGGIGCGKSTLASIIRRHGLPLIDTDDVARDLLQPGQEAFSAVVNEFGANVLNPAGEIDRKALAALVFPNPDARLKLEGILHPRIQQRWIDWVGDSRERGEAAAFVVIPLLYEKAYENSFDTIIAVGCSAATQQRRLLARGWSREAIQDRIAAQLSLVEKLRRSNFVLWSEGDLTTFESQTRRVLDRLGLDAVAGR